MRKESYDDRRATYPRRDRSREAIYGLGGAITATRSRNYAFDTGDTFSATVSITATDRLR